jgi:hypothetical protein
VPRLDRAFPTARLVARHSGALAAAAAEAPTLFATMPDIAAQAAAEGSKSQQASQTTPFGGALPASPVWL